MSRHTLPTRVWLTGIQCSTAHITDDDNSRLYHASHQLEDYGNGEWCHFTGTGYDSMPGGIRYYGLNDWGCRKPVVG